MAASVPSGTLPPGCLLSDPSGFGSIFSETASSVRVLRFLLFPRPRVAVTQPLASHSGSPAQRGALRSCQHFQICYFFPPAEPNIRFNRPSETQFTFQLLLPQPYRGSFQSTYICENGLSHCSSMRAHLIMPVIIKSHGLIECLASEEFKPLYNSTHRNVSS